MGGTSGADLYATYSRADALEALGVEKGREACGGQLIVARKRLVWLARAPEGWLAAPSRLSWTAANRYVEDRRHDFWFLPSEVRDLGGPTELGLEIFFSITDEDGFVYLGHGALVSYGFSSRESLGQAEVDLDVKLPRDVWLRLGGYEGWALSVDAKEHVGVSGDAAARIVEDAVAAGAGELWLTRYEEDSLLLLAERERAALSYVASPGDSGVYARDPEEEGSQRVACLTWSNGQVDEVPYEETIPKDRALAAVRRFLDTGELDPDVAWAES